MCYHGALSMYKDMLIGDGVLHSLNNSDENLRNEEAERLMENIVELQKGQALEPELAHSREQWCRNWTADEIEEATFLESDVDFGVYHSTPIYDLFHDGYSSLETGLKLKENNPKRVKLLGDVDPLGKDAIDEMERQVEEYGVDGFKTYPTYYRNDGRVRELRLDDDLLPIVEKAHELGIKHIGSHKVLPLGPVGIHNVDPNDVAEIAAMYPDIQFELLHPDIHYIHEIKPMTANFDNIWLNLELSLGILALQPRRFAEVLGELVLHGDPSKIIWATGVPLVHAQQYIEAFWEYQFPEDMQEEYGYPELTDEMKRGILGENLIDLYDWDADELREHVQNDKWAERLEEEGRPEPWSCAGIDVEPEPAAGDD